MCCGIVQAQIENESLKNSSLVIHLSVTYPLAIVGHAKGTISIMLDNDQFILKYMFILLIRLWIL